MKKSNSCNHDHQDHSNHNSHDHAHPPAFLGHAHGVSDRLWLAFLLNFSFAIIELIGGYLTNSVAIISDALHDFGDAMAIGLAIYFEKVSHKKSDASFSYGYRRYSTASAVITGFILFAGSILILFESIPRFFKPELPNTQGMILFAVLGLSVNGYAAFRISKGTSLSEKMILWHLIEDVAGWALVLVGALIMTIYPIPQIDAALGCALAIWIMINVYKNLKAALQVFLQAIPKDFDLEHLLQHLKKMDGVLDIHHVHLWSLDGEKHILTAHVKVASSKTLLDLESLKKQIKNILTKHAIFEATLEFEVEGVDCMDPTHS